MHNTLGMSGGGQCGLSRQYLERQCLIEGTKSPDIPILIAAKAEYAELICIALF